MGRGRSKHRRLIYSFGIVECSLLDCRGILFHYPRPSRLQILADEGYKPALLLWDGWQPEGKDLQRPGWRICNLTAEFSQ